MMNFKNRVSLTEFYDRSTFLKAARFETVKPNGYLKL